MAAGSEVFWRLVPAVRRLERGRFLFFSGLFALISLAQTLGLAGTTLLVTHDREEALATSDRIAIMGDRRIEQIGTPEEVYQNPLSAEVARLVGACELISGTYHGGPTRGIVETEVGTFPARSCGPIGVAEPISDGQEVVALMRASELEISPAGDQESAVARVESMEYHGEFAEYGLRLDSGVLIRVRRRSAEGIGENEKVVVQTRNESEVIVYAR